MTIDLTSYLNLCRCQCDVAPPYSTTNVKSNPNVSPPETSALDKPIKSPLTNPYRPYNQLFHFFRSSPMKMPIPQTTTYITKMILTIVGILDFPPRLLVDDRILEERCAKQHIINPIEKAMIISAGISINREVTYRVRTHSTYQKCDKRCQ